MLPRLIELLESVPTDPEGNRNVAVIAKHLLANGVVVPVRCKDCKNYKGEHYNCWMLRSKMQPNDFCSYGENGATDERN